MSPNPTAIFHLLSMANEKDKFAIELGLVLEPAMQEAFESGIDKQWFALVDVSPVACSPGRMLRVFRLTAAGKDKLAMLKEAQS